MADQSQIDALAERMKRTVSVLHLNANDAAIWEKCVRICAKEALRWRDETRPVQAPTTEALPVGRYSVGLVADGTGHCILLDGVECGGQWSGNDAETIVRALNAAMLAGAAKDKPAAVAVPSLWMRGDFLGVTDAAHVADRWRSEGNVVTAYAKLTGETAQLGKATPAALLTDEERKAIGGVMVNAEHDAIDVEDACPGIETNEDAYWAWNTYHGLKKLLAASDRLDALEATLKAGKEPK